MTAPNSPNQPEIDDVLADTSPPTHVTPIPVDVQGPVYTRELPSRFGTPRSYFVSNTDPVKALTPDPRRRSARIVSTDDDFYIGTSQQEAITSLARWPKNQPFILSHADEVWVMLATQASGRVSVFEEQWAG